MLISIVIIIDEVVKLTNAHLQCTYISTQTFIIHTSTCVCTNSVREFYELCTYACICGICVFVNFCNFCFELCNLLMYEL